MNFKIIATLVAALTFSTAVSADALDDAVAAFAEKHPEIGMIMYPGEANYLGIYLHTHITTFELNTSEVCELLVPGAQVELFFWDRPEGETVGRHRKDAQFNCPE